jgi:hypothetical protein
VETVGAALRAKMTWLDAKTAPGMKPATSNGSAETKV